MEYRFTQKYSKKDYIAFAMNHMKISILKPLNIFLFIASIGYLILTPLLTGGDYTFLYLAIGLIIVLVLFLLFTWVGAARTYNKKTDLIKIFGRE